MSTRCADVVGASAPLGPLLAVIRSSAPKLPAMARLCSGDLFVDQLNRLNKNRLPTSAEFRQMSPEVIAVALPAGWVYQFGFAGTTHVC
jgi:hypothetical protein